MNTDNINFCKVRSWCLFLVVVCMATVSATDAIAVQKTKDRKPHVVFLVSEDPDNYEAHKTIPAFADMLRNEHGFEVTVLLGKGPRQSFSFPGLSVLSKADLVVVFCRRVALPTEQLARLRNYLKAGKPLIGLRTANHAFSVREQPAPGHEAWWEFVNDILGCENRGYGPVEPGTNIAVASGAGNHPILQNVSPLDWHSTGNVYLVSPLLDKNATVLLTGSAAGKTEPVAWTRLTPDQSKIFYTSLGYPDDFQQKQFQQLVINGINWALKK